jgi:Fe2+ transport system protein FeoA
VLDYSSKADLTKSQLPNCSALCCSQETGQYRIVDLLESHPLSHRLAEMGFCQGTVLSLLSLGDPAMVSLGGSRMALNRNSMEAILVEKL